MYHRVAEGEIDPWYLCVSPEHFAAHLDLLRKHCHPMSLTQLVQAHRDGKVPNGAAAITFDDGYADNLYNARPLLDRYGTPATVFVTAGNADNTREFWWDELARALLTPGTLPRSLTLRVDEITHQWELGAATVYTQEDYQHDYTHDRDFSERVKFYYSVWEWLRPQPRDWRHNFLDQILEWAPTPSGVSPPHRFLEPDEVRKLGEGGLVEIGAHTVSHEMLPVHRMDFQRNEIEQNKIYLENLLGHAVVSFSYPFGEYSPETISLVREAGFSCACSVIPDVVWRASDPFLLPRLGVLDWDIEKFEKRLLRWLRGRME
jgi:peptidoglycan/xylan/chitin deacetylase (PgdA/CDA1 family)